MDQEGSIATVEHTGPKNPSGTTADGHPFSFQITHSNLESGNARETEALPFEGKTIVVTGAANGIGLAVMKELYGQGANVVAIDVNAEKLSQETYYLEDAAQGTGSQKERRITALAMDITRLNKLRKAIGALDRVDGAALCAAVIERPLDPEVPDSQPTHEDLENRIWDKNAYKSYRGDRERITKTNLHAQEDLARLLLSRMREHESGSLVFVGSTNVQTLNQARPAYGPAKSALENLAQSLARNYAKYGININTVSPGATMTDMLLDPEKARERMPLGVNEPEDVAHAITFMLSDRSRQIAGQNLPVEGGRLLMK